MYPTYSISGLTNTQVESRLMITEVNTPRAKRSVNMELVKGVGLFMGALILTLALIVLVN